MVGTVLPRPRRFLHCGRNCTGAAPGCFVSVHAAAGQEAGARPAQPLLRELTPHSSPSSTLRVCQQHLTWRAGVCVVLQCGPWLGGWVWFRASVLASPWFPARRPCSAYSAGPGPQVLNEVFDRLSAFLLELIPQLVQNPGRDLWSRSLGKCPCACISLNSHNCPESCIVPLQMRKGGPQEHKSLWR